jgi:hypothetical protein
LAQRLQAAVNVVRASLGEKGFDTKSVIRAIMLGELSRRLELMIFAGLEAKGPRIKTQN